MFDSINFSYLPLKFLVTFPGQKLAPGKRLKLEMSLSIVSEFIVDFRTFCFFLCALKFSFLYFFDVYSYCITSTFNVPQQVRGSLKKKNTTHLVYFYTRSQWVQ